MWSLFRKIVLDSFWVIFIYGIVAIATGIKSFDTTTNAAAWSGIITPLVVLSAGSTLRSVFYGDRSMIKGRIIFALAILSGMVVWIIYTGFYVVVFGTAISGWLWLMIGFLIGIIFTPKKLALQNIGAEKGR